MFGKRKAMMMQEIIDIINYDDYDQEPLIFNIYNSRGDVVHEIRGVTKQDIEKPKTVDINVPGGRLIVNEENSKMREIQNKYRNVWRSDIKDKRLNALAELRKETNWKLRVLNEQYYLKTEEREIREKEMRSGKETIQGSTDSEMREGANNLLFFSESVKKEAAKKNKKVKIKESIRRSARIAELVRRKSLRV